MDGWKPVLSFSYGKAALFIEGQMPDKGCKGHLEFHLKAGNAGTGMYQRGTFEQGCEFVPVAGYNYILHRNS